MNISVAWSHYDFWESLEHLTKFFQIFFQLQFIVNIMLEASNLLKQAGQTHFHQEPHQPRGCLQRVECNFGTV